MTTVYNINLKHHGEQSLAAEILKIAPLIEKHFKPFEGEKVSITTGNSAKFNKVCRAFYDEVTTISKARIYANVTRYSIWIKMDINEPSGDYGCNYFDQSVYLAETKDNAFKYAFNRAGCESYCHKILNTSINDLEAAKATIAAKKKEISALVDSIPYAFHSLVEGV